MKKASAKHQARKMKENNINKRNNGENNIIEYRRKQSISIMAINNKRKSEKNNEK